MRCDECRFWWQHGQGTDTPLGEGTCQRFPPTPVFCEEDGFDGHYDIQPHTLAEDWCGEFQPKETTGKKPSAIPSESELGTLGNVGIQGSEAGTSLRRIMLALSSAKGRVWLKEHGFSCCKSNRTALLLAMKGESDEVIHETVHQSSDKSTRKRITKLLQALRSSPIE